MVSTRSQVRNSNTTEGTRMSDNERDASFPKVLTREQMTEFDSNDILNRQKIMVGIPIDQRFNVMNRQIGELTDLVLALTQQISSNPREMNGLNVVTTSTNSRSDTRSDTPWIIFQDFGTIFAKILPWFDDSKSNPDYQASLNNLEPL